LHITSLEVENTKRVKALRLCPTKTGLTIVGGANSAGKTTILDSVAWALGGAKHAPSQPKSIGAIGDPHIRLELSNGTIVERKGKKSALTVTFADGSRGNQSAIDRFINEFALDLPKFLNATNREKAQVLLKVLGIGEQLEALDKREKGLYDERTAIGRIAENKKKYANELLEYPDAPKGLLSISALITQQQKILATNGENRRKRDDVKILTHQRDDVRKHVTDLECQLTEAKQQLAVIEADVQTANRTAADLKDEATDKLEAQIAQFESINAQVSTNQAKATAEDEANAHQEQYDARTTLIESVRAERLALLDSVSLPLPGLSVSDGELVYNEQKWDCMAASEQLRCAVAIVQALDPKDCRFVLMDKLEQLDLHTLQEFGTWLEAEGLQCIATRVSTGDECTLIIEDGLPAGKSYVDVVTGVEESATIDEEDDF